MLRRIGTLGAVALLALGLAVAASAAPGYGKLSGIVVDPSGTPQMGASVWVMAEGASNSPAVTSLTNQHGLFASDRLLPGLYSVRVTLAGFLPSLAQHVRISAHLTTLVKIELDSVFASLDRLRRRPNNSLGSDEWNWVLRASAATRPVLRWADGEVVTGTELSSAEAARTGRPRGRMELTSGARRPGSVANLADAPGTSFAYDQNIGGAGRLLLAGQMSYERSAAAGIATVWLPSGEPGRGPRTSVVLRQAKLGPSGPVFRGLRLAHDDQLALGDRYLLRYGAEYVLVGLGSATSSLRPRAELNVRLSPNWRAAALLAARPAFADPASLSALQSAVAELDAMPAVLTRDGHPVVEGGWHEEVAVERRVSTQGSVRGAVFHDRARHLPVFGRGLASNSDYLQDFFSDGFVYDGGASDSWGARVAYRQTLAEDVEIAAVYAWAGALAIEDLAADINLRDALRTRYRQSLAARVAGRLPKLGTQVAASYKWVNGAVVTRQDSFGEALYQLDPFLSLSVRQPLPSFVASGRWEALADFHNLLAQGYLRTTGEGQLVLVPAFRSFRGGVSIQF